MPVRRLYRVAVAFLALAIASAAAGLIVAQETGIEGAYFSRSVKPQVLILDDTVFSSWTLFFQDALIGASGAFLIAAIVVALTARRLARSEAVHDRA